MRRRCLLACALLAARAYAADDFQALLARATARYEKLDDGKALELLESARRAARGPGDLAAEALQRGLVLAHQGDLTRAAAAFRVAFLLEPKSALPAVAPAVREAFERVEAESA